jgi:predicted ribosome quality control (RQC) complex YloA/Tae2 family protein
MTTNIKRKTPSPRMARTPEARQDADEIVLDVRKTVEENAAVYFEKAKKAKRKIAGVLEYIAQAERKIDALNVQASREQGARERHEEDVSRAKEWFEKFRWCISSDGFLIVGGRDATSNEVIVKKHLLPADLVFHTESAGSPFVVIKNPEGGEVPDTTKEQAAQLCGMFSKAWKSGVRSADVFMIKPEQVSKEAKAGEYIAKGSFMIYGQRDYRTVDLRPAILVHEGRVMCGPQSAISAYAAAKGVASLELDHGEEKL